MCGALAGRARSGGGRWGECGDHRRIGRGRTDLAGGREEGVVGGGRRVAAGVPHEPALLVVALVDAHHRVVDGSGVPGGAGAERQDEAARGRRRRGTSSAGSCSPDALCSRRSALMRCPLVCGRVACDRERVA